MLISKIQQDLFNFIEQDSDVLPELIQFWYSVNGNALSAALRKEEGLKLMLNVNSFENFENLSKKLFLIADTLVLRDTRTRHISETEPRGTLFIENYKPNFLDDETLQELQALSPSPYTIFDPPSRYWTSSSKELKNGHTARWAFDITHSLIPPEFTQWISNSGKKYLSTGSVIYAPFIPPVDFEIELLKHKVSLPESFNTQPLFCEENIMLGTNALEAISDMQIPFLENIDIQTLHKIKQDDYDSFKQFSSSLLYAIQNIKSITGTANFKQEVQYIQKNLIDDNIDKINQSFTKLKRYRSLQKMGLAISVLGVSTSIVYPEYAAFASISGVVPSIITFVADLVAQLKKNNQLVQQEGYFLWKLKK